MSTNKNDYEHMLFYFAYKTFITTADEIIEKYGMSRQHHRFLFFINKLPGITIKSLLEILEISKQGSHATLQKLKEQGLIIENYIRRIKAINSLLNWTRRKMNYCKIYINKSVRIGIMWWKHWLKGDLALILLSIWKMRKKASIRNVKNLRILKFKKYVKKCIIKTYNLIELSFNTS